MPRSSDDGTKPAPGIYRKFTVMRTDGSSEPGHKHEHCHYFVLDWIHDRYAVPAALAYAAACEAEYPELARDLRFQAHNTPYPKSLLAAGVTAGEAKPAPDLSGIATCRDCTAERTCDRCAEWLAGRP